MVHNRIREGGLEVKNMITLSDVKKVQPGWFSEENKAFFRDVQYWLIFDPAGNPYLARSTYAWTDMFERKRKLHYRLNNINPDTLKIESLFDEIFEDPIDMEIFVTALYDTEE